MQNFLLPRLDFVHYTNLWRQRNTSTLESLAWCHRFLALAKSCGYRKGSVCGERGGQGSLQHYECGVSIALAVRKKKVTELPLVWPPFTLILVIIVLVILVFLGTCCLAMTREGDSIWRILITPRKWRVFTQAFHLVNQCTPENIFDLNGHLVPAACSWSTVRLLMWVSAVGIP